MSDARIAPALGPRPTDAFRIGTAPDGAREVPIISTHEGGLDILSVTDAQQPGTSFRAVALEASPKPGGAIPGSHVLSPKPPVLAWLRLALLILAVTSALG